MITTWIPSTPFIGPCDIAHLFVPGRGRSEDGMGLSAISEARVDAAAGYYVDLGLAEKDGVIICSGYKSPSDKSGEPWTDGENDFVGRPEAYSSQRRLVEHGIDPSHIVVEPLSIDTPTNFAHGRALIPDKRVLGIVAQEEHLKRMMKPIATHLLEQQCIGLVVPELPDNIDHDTPFAKLATWATVVGTNPETSTEHIIARSERVWQAVLLPDNARSAAERIISSLSSHAENA